jgi:hypothetical protein
VHCRSPSDQAECADAERPPKPLHEMLLSVPSPIYGLGFALGVGIAMLPLIAIHVVA